MLIIALLLEDLVGDCWILDIDMNKWRKVSTICTLLNHMYIILYPLLGV